MATLPKVLTQTEVPGPASQRGATAGDFAAGAETLIGATRTASNAARGAADAQRSATSALRKAAATGADVAQSEARAVANLGASLTNLGGAIYELDERMTRTRRAAELGHAKSEDGLALQEFSFSLANGRQGPDGTSEPPAPADKRVELLKAKVAELRKARATQWEKDPAALQSYSDDLAELALRQELDVRKGVVETKRSERGAFLARSEENFERAIYSAGMETRPLLMEQFKLETAEAVVNGTLSPVQGEERLHKMRRSQSRASYRADLREDPAQLVKDLRTMGPFPGIELEEHEQWISQAEEKVKSLRREAVDEERRREHLTDKAERTARGDAVNSILERVNGGEAVPYAEVQQLRKDHDLSPSEFKMISTAVQGGPPVKRDDGLYIGLMRRASKAAPGLEAESILDAAATEVGRRKLRVEDWKAIKGDLRDESGKSELPGFYKYGTEHLGVIMDAAKTARSSGLSKLSKNQGELERLKADALDEWRTWSLEHKDAKYEDAKRAWKDIGSRVASVKPTFDSVLAPRFLVGDRSAPDLRATGSKLLEAKTRGDLSEREYNREMARLQVWLDIEADTKKSAATQPGGAR